MSSALSFVGVPPHGSGDDHASPRQSPSTVSLFLDLEYTQGFDSQNFVLRHLVHPWHVIKVTFLSSYVNFLLVMVPVGIVAGGQGWNPTAVFTINVLAIIPLAAVMSFATGEISLKLGGILGGLLNAAFGNAVELIVSIITLKENHIDIVQASMLGSILSNLLLMMGMCFLFSGVIHRGPTGNGTEQVFSSATAQTTCSLMALSSASLIIPAILFAIVDQSGFRDKDKSILTLSHGTAIILLLLYVPYLVFQLRTHSNLFDAENQDSDERE
ncbi:Vacuolar calcium ion transporter [Fusarium sp. LHS14.1]|nr:Vacuolar calcium ion transporter [Fusarium sp. LHS14.1]